MSVQETRYVSPYYISACSDSTDIQGAVRAVIRAVPIAVLKPMIGATEAVGQTLMGIHNSLDPKVRTENEAKYKHR